MSFADNILKLATKFHRQAFAPNPDPELESPTVIIQPMEGLVQQAVNRIKQMEPNYFKGVRSIIIEPQSHYGSVESGPEKDPTVIHLNYNRIRQEITAQGGSDEDVINSIIQTIAHEAGHVKSFSPEQGFVGGEQPAEQEAQRVSGLMPRQAQTQLPSAKIQAARTAINILSKLPDDIQYNDVMQAYAALRNGGWQKGELPDIMKALAIWYTNRKAAVNYLLFTSHQGLPIEQKFPGGGGQGVVNDLKRIVGG